MKSAEKNHAETKIAKKYTQNSGDKKTDGEQKTIGIYQDNEYCKTNN